MNNEGLEKIVNLRTENRNTKRNIAASVESFASSPDVCVSQILMV